MAKSKKQLEEERSAREATAKKEQDKADRQKAAEERKAAQGNLTENPAFRDEGGNLFKLRPTDFPKTREGRVGWCDYQIEKWTDKKAQVEKQADPKARKLAKLEKLKAKLAELEAELEEEASDE